MDQKQAARFVQITCTSKSNLFALDEEGGVWHYLPFKPPTKPGDKPRYAFWAKLTNYRRDPADKNAQLKEDSTNGSRHEGA